MRWQPQADSARLAAFIARHPRVVVISGAGCSVASGLPAYRNEQGDWTHPRPVLYQDFLRDGRIRRRYWARSFGGWPRFAGARPNRAHLALAALERSGHIDGLITQNVDRLHQAAGSERVTDLHGRLDRVRCLGCGRRSARAALQEELAQRNPAWDAPSMRVAPDGDTTVSDGAEAAFQVPDCASCGGVLKPDVVFYGQMLEPATAAAAQARVAAAAALLVVGSSLMVFSAFRLVRDAASRGIPVAAINRGATRADALLSLKLQADCVELLPRVLAELGGSGPAAASAG